jgi:hypothetical protein
VNDISQTGDGILFANTGTIDGDVTVDAAGTPFWLEAFPGEVSVDPVAVTHTSPSALLRAAAQIVPFFGRADELSELTSWRDTAEKMSVILVFGPGGQGKTRLATKFAEQSASGNWVVGQARHESDPQPGLPKLTGLDDNEADVLIVVDYAERWPRTHLKRLLEQCRSRGVRRLRVLLLARPAGYWWKALTNPLLKLGATRSALRLGPLADTVSQRRAAFVIARDRFARTMGVTGTAGLRPMGSLADDAYGLALTLHMAALVVVDAHSRKVPVPGGPGRLSEYLVRREYDHWQTLHDNGRLSVPPPTMARLVALATLTQSLPYPDAEQLLVETGLAGHPAAAQSMVDAHLMCYPAVSGSSHVLAPLLPDRLGEDFIAQILPGGTEEMAEGDPWMARVPHQLLLGSANASSYRPAVLTVLIETAARWTHVRDEYLVPLLSEKPELALEAKGASLGTLAAYADLDLLKTLDAILPDRHVELDSGIAALTRRLTGYALAQTTDNAVKARLTEDLAARLSNAGLYDEAVSAAQDAIAIRRTLAADSPDKHEPLLADSLGNAGIDLWHVGRLNEAVDSMTEAVDIYRRHAASAPEAYEEDLAAELTNLTGALIGADRHEEARGPAEEATARFRALNAAKSGLDHELASALRNYSIVLSKLDFDEQALAAIEEAVAGYRKLAARQPETYEMELAEALDSLGNRLSRCGRPQAAWQANAESVALLRRLADANPAAHRRSLALGLNSLASRLWRLQERDTSLSISEEAVDLAHQLAERNKAGKQVLGLALNNLSQHLAELGRRDEALPVVDEAIAVWQSLVADEPGTFDGRLNRALSIRATIDV